MTVTTQCHATRPEIDLIAIINTFYTAQTPGLFPLSYLLAKNAVWHFFIFLKYSYFALFWGSSEGLPSSSEGLHSSGTSCNFSECWSTVIKKLATLTKPTFEPTGMSYISRLPLSSLCLTEKGGNVTTYQWSMQSPFAGILYLISHMHLYRFLSSISYAA